MRLSLPFDASWVIKDAPNDQRAAILAGAPDGPPAAIVTYGPIIVRPDESKRWLEQVVRFDLPPGMKVELGSVVDHKTADGWPMRLVETLVSTPKGDVAEARLAAIYTFMEHGAVAIARTADRGSMESHGKAILGILERGRPDWRGEPACLAGAWDLDAAAPAAAPVPALAAAQAKLAAKDYEGALAGFQQVTKLDPTNFFVLRHVIRCLYALGRFDAAQNARVAFRKLWEASGDRRAQLVHEYMFDQFDGNGFAVQAFETLRPHNPAIHPVYTFRAVGDREQPLPASVLIETSEQARAAGTPFVLAATSGSQYRVIGAAKELPAYADLRQDVRKLIGEALGAAR